MEEIEVELPQYYRLENILPFKAKVRFDPTGFVEDKYGACSWDSLTKNKIYDAFAIVLYEEQKYRTTFSYLCYVLKDDQGKLVLKSTTLFILNE